MIELGFLSAYSTSSLSSVYSTEISSVEKNKETTTNEAPKNLDDINDEAIISDEAQNLYNSDTAKAENDKSESDNDDSSQSENDDELTPEQKEEVAELKVRDAEVKAHEQAHRTAGAGVSTSAPHYEYQTGPDNKKYAIGGEVSISFTQSSDPASNIAKAEAVVAAALAPSEPSAQDLSVAQSARQMIAQSKIELAQQQQQQLGNSSNTEEQETKPIS